MFATRMVPPAPPGSALSVGAPVAVTASTASVRSVRRATALLAFARTTPQVAPTFASSAPSAACCWRLAREGRQRRLPTTATGRSGSKAAITSCWLEATRLSGVRRPARSDFARLRGCRWRWGLAWQARLSEATRRRPRRRRRHASKHPPALAKSSVSSMRRQARPRMGGRWKAACSACSVGKCPARQALCWRERRRLAMPACVGHATRRQHSHRRREHSSRRRSKLATASRSRTRRQRCARPSWRSWSVSGE